MKRHRELNEYFKRKHRRETTYLSLMFCLLTLIVGILVATFAYILKTDHVSDSEWWAGLLVNIATEFVGAAVMFFLLNILLTTVIDRLTIDYET